MIKKWEVFGALSFLVSIPILSVFYNLLNNANRGVYSLITDIDRGIPLIKFFIIPYVAWFLYIFLVFLYLCIRDREVYYKTLIAYNSSLVICYLVYFFYQTTVPRPDVAVNDIFTKIISMVYASDEPFNCFPSIHSLTSFLMIKAIGKSKLKNRLNTALIYGMSSLIIMSTLFVKQHVVIDALSAILLGNMIFELVFRFDKERVVIRVKRVYSLLTMRKRLET